MRILLLTSDVPATSSMPGSPRAFSLFRDLAQRHEIHLATFVSSVDRLQTFVRSGNGANIFRSINVLCTPVVTSLWGRQLHRITQSPYFVTRYRCWEEFRLVRQRIWELIQQKKPNLLFADGLPASQYILHCDGLRRVVDAHDAVSMNVRRTAAYADSRVEKLQLFLEAQSIHRFEMTIARVVDAYLVNSRIDRAALQDCDRGMRVWCIPNGVDTEYFAPDGGISDGRTAVFTGVMNYRPNRDAAHFLCKEIFPRVREVVPDVQVRLVGANPPDDVRALAGNGVTVTGTVPDVRPFIHRAAVYVSPLRFGTGVKNKVLAALAMGKAVVATPESCAGLDVTSGEHLLVGESPDALAAHIVALLTDPSRRCLLGSAGRKLVVQKYQWTALAKQLEELLESLLAERKDTPDESSLSPPSTVSS